MARNLVKICEVAGPSSTMHMHIASKLEIGEMCYYHRLLHTILSQYIHTILFLVRVAIGTNLCVINTSIFTVS